MGERKTKRQSVCGSGSYIQRDVLCPFYKRDDGKRTVVCEGIVDNSSVGLSYRYESLYRTQMEVFCCSHYRNCEVFRMLMYFRRHGK